METQDDWKEVWDARIQALENVLGPSHDQVFHASHPFFLGGQADVVAFFKRFDGAAYVTAELSGKPGASYADYELMICHKSPQDWGPNVISRLAPYTQKSYINPGDTMDIDSATPADSKIKAFLFTNYASFTLFGESYDLRLCIGITKDELKYKMESGSDYLLALLKERGVYPFTDLSRESVSKATEHPQ